MPKILVIRFSSIGDIVLTTPIIRCLKQQINGAEVHLLTKTAHEHLAKNNAYIDKYFLLEHSLSKITPLLREENYDYIIDLHNNIRSRKTLLHLDGKTLTFNKLNIRKWIFVNWKLNFMPDVHIVDRYFSAVKSLGVINDGKGLDYFIPEKERVSLNTLPATHRDGYIGFVIGANYSTKRLPVKKIISICKKINRPIVLLGWKGDEGNGNQIWQHLGDQVYNACGKYNLDQSASLVEQAEFIISHDTGLMHIASALGKKVISIWGNTVPEFGMTPYLPKEMFSIEEVKNLKCRPCSKIGYQKCPERHFKCMNHIDEQSIVDTTLKWQSLGAAKERA